MTVLLSLALLALGGPDQEAGAERRELRPAELSWAELSPSVFDRRWVLPEPRSASGRDLLEEMRRLLGLKFEVQSSDGASYRCFGDLVEAIANFEGADGDRWYAELAQAAPKLFDDWGRGWSELLFEADLASAEWSPTRESGRDGLLFADAWDLGAESNPPWTQLSPRPLAEQVAALLRADLSTIRAVESDYVQQRGDVGARYEELTPLEGSYFAGVDDAGRAFSTLAVFVRCDLPFPYSGYSTTLRVLNRFGADGVLRSNMYSTGSDFLWLAGRDTYLPVENSEGQRVAYLLIRQFGFDLRDVPDDGGHRRRSLVGTVGNLKRNAERRYAAALGGGISELPPSDVLRSIPVIGPP